MAATQGYLSTIKIGSTAIKNIKSTDLSQKIASLETTSFSATTPGVESYIGGIFSGSMKLSGQYDKADTGQNTIETDFYARTITSFVFSPDGTHTYTVNCLITEYDVKSDVKNLVTADFTLMFTDTGVTPA